MQNESEVRALIERWSHVKRWIAAGWKPHAAGPCPVPLDSKPGVMFAGGEIVEPGVRQAQFWKGIRTCWWRHITAHPASNIIAYLPEEPTASPASTAHS